MLIPTAFLTICAAFGIGSLAGPWGGLIGLAAACVLGPYLWKKHNRALSPPPVTVSTDHLTGPLTVHSALESVPLESIRSIEIRKVGAHPLLVIGAEDAAFMWPAGLCCRPDPGLDVPTSVFDSGTEEYEIVE